MNAKSYSLPKLNIEFENGKNGRLSKSKFDIVKSIGKGAFGQVFHVISKFSKIDYAMKVMEKNEIESQNLSEQVKREIHLLNKCRHPHVIKLYACFENSK